MQFLSNRPPLSTADAFFTKSSGAVTKRARGRPAQLRKGDDGIRERVSNTERKKENKTDTSKFLTRRQPRCALQRWRSTVTQQTAFSCVDESLCKVLVFWCLLVVVTGGVSVSVVFCRRRHRFASMTDDSKR
jgi:hypothetical protein